MAKKYYNGEITLNTDWGGDESTGNLPVVGSRVQEAIKKGINSKAGFVGRVEKVGQGFYVLSRDEATFNEYLKTISDENPFEGFQLLKEAGFKIAFMGGYRKATKGIDLYRVPRIPLTKYTTVSQYASLIN